MMKRVYRCLILLSVTAVLQTTNVFAQYPGSKQWPLVDGTSVTFLLKADAASDVQLYGDFLPGVNQYNLGGHVTMARNSEGLWEYKAENLPPDFYFYYYEVDGVRVLDPNNLHLVCNYSEYLNSFLVKGPESRNYELTGVPAGTVITHWYDSPEYSGQRRLNVWLPADYSETNRYPVLYMIPGGGDDEDTWVDMGRLPQIMSHLTASGEAVPMIVVMVNAMPNQLAAPHVMDPIPGKKYHFELMGTPEHASGGEFTNDMVRNIIPFIERHYSVRSDRDSRAVCGVSMGGVYETYLLEHHPELFGHIAYIGSGMMNTSPEEADQKIAPLLKMGYRLMWIGAGSKDMALRSAKGLMETLDRHHQPYVYYDSGDGHNWRSWRRDLVQLAPKLFR